MEIVELEVTVVHNASRSTQENMVFAKNQVVAHSAPKKPKNSVGIPVAVFKANVENLVVARFVMLIKIADFQPMGATNAFVDSALKPAVGQFAIGTRIA